MIWWPFGKERRIRCKDGSDRYVFKDPQDAFPLIAREWTRKAKASVDTLSELKAGASGEIQSSIGTLLFDLDEKNAAVQQKCCALYVVYKVDPCGLDAWLKQQVTEVLQEETFLRRLDAEIKHIRDAIRGQISSEELIKRLDAFSEILDISDEELQTRKQFEKALELVKRWKGES